MIDGKKILAVIPARGGSKGLPRKNLLEMCGKPLIAWTIEQAMHSKHIDRIFVSTDSREIADVAEKQGVDVPFLRPDEFARDSSPTSEAVIHALDSFEVIGERYDYVTVLEPTSPLRKQDDIDKGIARFASNERAQTLISVGEVHTEHPMIVKKLDRAGFVSPYLPESKRVFQRQQVDKAYFPYGVIYLSRTEAYRTSKTFYSENTLSLEIERWQNYEIDDALDFLVVEQIMKKYIGGNNG